MFSFMPIVSVQRHQCLGTHKPPNSSPQQKVCEAACDIFILMHSIIISIHFGSNQPPISLKITTGASMIREPNVGHHTNKFTETGLEIFIKYPGHSMQIFAVVRTSHVTKLKSNKRDFQMQSRGSVP